MKSIIPFIMSALLLLSSCVYDTGTGFNPDDFVPANPSYAGNVHSQWWVLTNDGSSQISLYNHQTGRTTRTLNVPAQLNDPQALAFDGESLWVGGTGSGAAVYQLDPTDGSILSVVEGIQTKGLTYAEGQVWYLNGNTVRSLPVSGGTSDMLAVRLDAGVTDITMSGTHLYSINSRMGEVKKYSLANSREEASFSTGIDGATNISYTENAFNLVTESNQFCAFSVENGNMNNDIPIDTPSDVTAIAPGGPVQ